MARGASLAIANRLIAIALWRMPRRFTQASVKVIAVMTATRPAPPVRPGQ